MIVKEKNWSGPISKDAVTAQSNSIIRSGEERNTVSKQYRWQSVQYLDIPRDSER